MPLPPGSQRRVGSKTPDSIRGLWALCAPKASVRSTCSAVAPLAGRTSACFAADQSLFSVLFDGLTPVPKHTFDNSLVLACRKFAPVSIVPSLDVVEDS